MGLSIGLNSDLLSQMSIQAIWDLTSLRGSEVRDPVM